MQMRRIFSNFYTGFYEKAFAFPLEFWYTENTGFRAET